MLVVEGAAAAAAELWLPNGVWWDAATEDLLHCCGRT